MNSVQLSAQDEFLDPPKKRMDYSGAFDFQQQFNAQDYQLGMSFGFEEKNYEWGLKLGFMARPFRKFVLQNSTTVTRQYREGRFQIHLEISKRIGHFDLFNQHFQFLIAAQGATVFRNYAGTKDFDPGAFVTVIPKLGLCYNLDFMYINFGYSLYADRIVNVDNNRLFLNFLFLF